MKSKFIKISRICVMFFFVVIAILVGWIFVTKDQEVILPTVLGILPLLSGLAMVICIIIAFILDMVDSLKRDKFKYLIGNTILIAVLWLVLVIFEYFTGDKNVQLINLLGQSALSVCAVRAGSYIFTNHD